jgi:hypothetical protein
MKTVIAGSTRNPRGACPQVAWIPGQARDDDYIEKIFPGFMMFSGKEA